MHLLNLLPQGLLSALVCARAMAASADIDGAPMLLITDNELLRRMVADGYFAGIVGPPVVSPGLAPVVCVCPMLGVL